MTATYHPCARCKFFVTSQDEHCANCGIPYPLDYANKLEKALKTSDLLGCGMSIIWVMGCFIVLALMSKTIAKIFDSAMGVTIIFTPIVIVGMVFFIKRFSKEGKLARLDSIPEATPNLINSERTIKSRISELTNRQKQITEILLRAKENKRDQWVRVGNILKDTNETLRHQCLRYNLKLIEIEVARWQNTIVPIIFETSDLSYEEIEKRLVAIESAGVNGKHILAKVQKMDESNGFNSDAQELYSRIKETAISCITLHEALLSQQAVIALKGIEPLKHAINTPEKPIAAIRRAEIFNIQVAITDFSSSFKELEAEYIRVKSEYEIGENINQMIEKMENG